MHRHHILTALLAAATCTAATAESAPPDKTFDMAKSRADRCSLQVGQRVFFQTLRMGAYAVILPDRHKLKSTNESILVPLNKKLQRSHDSKDIISVGAFEAKAPGSCEVIVKRKEMHWSKWTTRKIAVTITENPGK